MRHSLTVILLAAILAVLVVTGLRPGSDHDPLQGLCPDGTNPTYSSTGRFLACQEPIPTPFPSI